MAIQNGDTWLKTHEEQLTRFSSKPLHSIKRWNDFLFDPKYPETFQKVMYLYQSDRIFRDTVLRSAQLHLTRIKQTNHPELITHSINYLLEECAGMAIVFGQAPEKGCVELYPGNLADCLDYLTGKALPEILRGLSIRQSAIVDFEEYRPDQNPMIF